MMKKKAKKGTGVGQKRYRYFPGNPHEIRVSVGGKQ